MERRLPGGNTGGAVQVGDTVRRTPGPWSASVHAVLEHLHDVGFDRCPRPLGFDDQGREVLTFLPGRTVGDAKPWPSWVHSDAALREAATWLRDYHQAVAGFRVPDSAHWRSCPTDEPAELICHNDAAPYNAVWNDRGLVGFFDWDFAGPGTRAWDLAFTVCAWVPLHARHVAREEGFTAFDERRRRLDLFLDTYGWQGGVDELSEVLRRRLAAHSADVERLAAEGDPFFVRLVEQGTVRNVQTALQELPAALAGLA